MADQQGIAFQAVVAGVLIVEFFLLIGVVIRAASSVKPWMLLSLPVGMLLADFTSGVAHWLADTWGSASWPVVGSWIKPFRDHHTDPKSILEHGFLLANGHNALIVLPAILLLLVIPSAWTFTTLTLVVFCVSVILTNQVHKWAHADSVPYVVAALQKLRVILPKDNHDTHHTSPFATNYCITTGWLNYPLQRMKFFRGLEWIVTKLTHAAPRQDEQENYTLTNAS